MQPNQGPYQTPQQQQVPPAPPGQVPPGMVAQQQSNAIAIIGLILSFLFWPAGLVCSIIGLKKAKELGGSGHGMALAGLIISSVFAIIALLVFVLTIIAAIAVESEPTHIGF